MFTGFSIPHTIFSIVEEYMNERVSIVITDNQWDDKFDQVISLSRNICLLLRIYKKMQLLCIQL